MILGLDNPRCEVTTMDEVWSIFPDECMYTLHGFPIDGYCKFRQGKSVIQMNNKPVITQYQLYQFNFIHIAQNIYFYMYGSILAPYLL